ncbi:MAG: patatin-like phospholipase family protein [Acidimicrobiia bacterium]|nr:patatin-like phospholipase family protein [Acidimicrobiia bacterium]
MVASALVAIHFVATVTLGSMSQWTMDRSNSRRAWVLGGGGLRGAAEVGMARALAAAGLQPDLVVGTSVGSINGAVLASAPIDESVARLTEMWESMAVKSVFQESLISRVRNLVNHWTHLHSNEPLRRLIDQWVPYAKVEDAHVHFECVAACIETSSEHWFTSGSVRDAILASCALPGVLPPVKVGGRHYIDGGVVNSIPVSRAIELGADEIYVLHVGHIDDELEVPRHPWDVAMVSFEIARRHRFHTEMNRQRDGVTIHVMPTGRAAGRYNDLSKLRYNNVRPIRAAVKAAEAAGTEYLEHRASGQRLD